MSKNINQKQKLITLLNILETKTDENHKLSAADLISELEKNDITAERKSIYSDVNTLCDMGYDIVLDKSKTGGYYMASRTIEKHEMVLLVDAVSSSKFITLKKSRELIKKLESLLSVYEARELDREVFVNNRIKQDNESIYYIVDDIHNSISQHKIINFKYCEWNNKKELVPRHGGKIYSVSPLSLAWDDEKYYLIGVDNEINQIRHYRVDKIKDIVITNDNINFTDEHKNFDIAKYTNTIFGMYGGETIYVDLSFDESGIGLMIDRFGKDISIRRGQDGKLHSRVEISISSQFFGWILGLNNAVTISGPESVRDEYRQFLTKSVEAYY